MCDLTIFKKTDGKLNKTFCHEVSSGCTVFETTSTYCSLLLIHESAKGNFDFISGSAYAL